MIKEETRCRFNPDCEAITNREELATNPQLYYKKHKPTNVWFQTNFTSEKGTVSLIHLGFKDYLYGDTDEDYLWEIYSNGKLFEDVERFKTLFEAMDRIRFLLQTEY